MFLMLGVSLSLRSVALLKGFTDFGESELDLILSLELG